VAVGLFTRAIRPPDDITPNANDPASVPPATVGPPAAVPGDPHGAVIAGEDPPAWVPPRISPSAWSGWPADWGTSWTGSQLQSLTDTAWMCVDLNASVLSEMPPYLVDAAPSLSADWLGNPDPDLYTGWEEFIKQYAWDYQLGEAFVLATARYATGWPARFHVVPPWTVNVEMDAGRRRYSIGRVDVTDDLLHVRYQSTTADAHGHGPLEAGAGRLVAAGLLARYATGIVTNGGIPSSVIMMSETASPAQAEQVKEQWIQARLATPGAPAVLAGGLEWKPTQLDPSQMALVDLSRWNEARIAYMLGVPGPLVGLPGSGDSLTYNTVLMIFLQHWRAGLKPKAQTLMSALSGWALPRGTRVELNRDSYIEPEPLQRAQTAQILHAIVDPVTGQQALTVDEIRAAERLDDSSPPDVAAGVLR
jgi:HK97 family phage portal protein